MMTEANSKQEISLYDLSREQLGILLAGWGYSDYHAAQLWQGLYQQQVSAPGELKELRPDLLERLSAETYLDILSEDVVVDSSDGFTRKYLLRLVDGQSIETVLMTFKGRTTACVSTQVGCAMGCVFCATGQMGFRRNLSAGEIVAQVLHVSRVLHAQDERLRNIVLMGMGEPLHNYEATMKALEIIMDHNGLAIAPRHITLSTVGLVPGIKRLADEDRPFRLAVSLHGATDSERQALVPPARRWPLAELIAACHYYCEKRKRRIFFEWALIAGENDKAEQAHALGALIMGLDAHVNLIPLNPTSGFYGQPTHSQDAKHFQSILAQYGIPSTVRQRRGIDIAAGCGQLRSDQLANDSLTLRGSEAAG
ncbi:MAG: 23S rRNA (adenine(2503)-C(2))-methyltransferase RlmN [Candidatus Promineifilaceae bacterium]|nr:23S rRNA (adenine(2503)-C(2))-methyltransferase RlmN [Candidatus Promineifilaceae bacterium]